MILTRERNERGDDYDNRYELEEWTVSRRQGRKLFNCGKVGIKEKPRSTTVYLRITFKKRKNGNDYATTFYKNILYKLHTFDQRQTKKAREKP